MVIDINRIVRQTTKDNIGYMTLTGFGDLWALIAMTVS